MKLSALWVVVAIAGCGKSSGSSESGSGGGKEAAPKGLFAAAKSSYQWGFIDDHGNWVIQPTFGRAGEFNSGRAQVSSASTSFKHGFIDQTGKLVVPEKLTAPYVNYALTIHDNSSGFHDGAALVQNGADLDIIDVTGAVTFTIKSGHSISSVFRDGLTGYCTVTPGEKSKCGYVDRMGKIAVPLEYAGVSVYGFTEGLGGVFDADSKYGFVDKTGRLVIPQQYAEAREFSEGLAAVAMTRAANPEDTEYSFIDKTGKVAIKGPFKGATAFHDGLAIVDGSKRNEKQAIDKTGKTVFAVTDVPSDSRCLLEFHDGLACRTIGHGEVRFIDKTGKELVAKIDARHQNREKWYVHPFRDGLARIDIRSENDESVASTVYVNTSGGVVFDGVKQLKN